MSKSRRDLSLVAIAALVASSFAMSAPAQAAGELKIEPTSGSGFAVPHKDSISLTVSATGGNDSDELNNLKYLISNDGSFDVSADQSDVATRTADLTAERIDSSDSESKVVLDADEYEDGDNINVLTLAVEDNNTAFDGTDSTKRVTVVAFVDKDNSDTPNDDEWQITQEATFYDWDDVEVTTVLTQPVLGDTTRTATLSDANFNLAQSSLGVAFVDKGTEVAFEDSSSTTRTYSSTRDDLTISFEGQTAVDKGTYSAAVYWSPNSEDGATDSVNRLAPLSTRSVAEADVEQITGTAARTDSSEAIAEDDGSKNIKAGSGSLTYVVEITENDGTPVADKTVTLVVSETAVRSLDAGSVTIGSSTLTNADNGDLDTMSVTATSDSDGEATFVVSWADLDDADAFAIQAVADGEREASVSLTAKDAAVTQVVSADVIANDEQLVVATDESFTLTYHVLDQFGALYSGSDATVSVTDGNGSGNTYTGSVSNGAATVTMPSYDEDNDGAIQLVADVATTGGGDATTSFDHTVFVGSPNAPAAVAIAGDYGTAAAPLNLNSNSTVRADARFAQYTIAPDSEIDASATVADGNGNGTRSEVTFSGENLIFESESHSTGPVFRTGSLTVWTDASGVADVSISSQRSGKQVLTVTAGGASKTQDIYFGAVADTAGTNLELEMPATVAAGSTFQVTGTLTDKFGNPVQVASDSTDAGISVTYDGPGLSVGTLPDSTDKNGQFKFGVLLGSNDSGTGTVTASYDQNGDDDFTDAKDITESESINNGSGTFTGTYGDVTAWTVNQGDGTAKVYVKFPPVGEKLRILHQTGGSGSYTSIYADTTDSEDMDGLRQVAGVGTYVVRTIDLADGTNRIRVSLDGEDIEVNGKDRPARYNE